MMYQQKNIWIRLFYTIITIFICIPSAGADIYVFKDNSGVRHFTNVPVSPKYRLYLKSTPNKYFNSGLGEKFSTNIDPDQYDDLILKASLLHDVDFSLLKSIIKVESNFDCYAVSQKGAKGLMQIMPQNFFFLNIRNPFDPEENIMGGALYFKQMLEKFNKIELALAAYNAGPNLVDKYNGIPPISETKGYVKKVMSHYKGMSDNKKKST
ncbi:MAG: lytic transglycosylase domain-containing protein [Deltaproteobacteria bacterium]|nr:lytic transglycosylase domain-containing protein [Deltaproteobacteria bacterium]